MGGDRTRISITHTLGRSGFYKAILLEYMFRAICSETHGLTYLVVAISSWPFVRSHLIGAMRSELRVSLLPVAGPR